MEWIVLIVGIFGGVFFVYTINKMRDKYEEERRKNATLETKLQALEGATNRLSDTFAALSQEALKSNNQMFLDLAKSSLETLVSDAKGEFGKSQQAIDGMIQPLKESLSRYEQQISALEKKRATDYGSLDAQIKALMGAQQELQKETGNLVTALTKPQVKGSWGQSTLKRVVELAGMSEFCDFTEEVSVNTEEGRLRPDMVVHLPSNREIVIDSKVSTEAYLKAVEAKTEDERKNFLTQHAQQVKKHMRELSSKSYWSQFPQTPEFVVMFLPSESFFSAAVSIDKSLMEEGWQNKVIIATPTNLISLLRAVAYGWKQEQMAKHAVKVAELGREMYERLAIFVSNFQRVGNSIEKAVDAYNASAGSLEARVLVTARKFKDMGVQAKEDMGEVAQIDKNPRTISADEKSLASSTGEQNPN